MTLNKICDKIIVSESSDMNNKQQNFIRISTNRVEKITAMISQLTNLTNTSFYDYSNEQIEDMFSQIESATAKAKASLINNKKKGKKEI